VYIVRILTFKGFETGSFAGCLVHCGCTAAHVELMRRGEVNVACVAASCAYLLARQPPYQWFFDAISLFCSVCHLAIFART
jgi:hypothetical protein